MSRQLRTQLAAARRELAELEGRPPAVELEVGDIVQLSAAAAAGRWGDLGVDAAAQALAQAHCETGPLRGGGGGRSTGTVIKMLRGMMVHCGSLSGVRVRKKERGVVAFLTK